MTKKVINKFKKEIKMKKILLAIAFVVMMSVGANAQSDGFFKNWNNGGGNRTSDDNPGFVLPSGIDMSDAPINETPDAPLGSGLLILTAIGAGYALKRRRDNR